MTGQIQCLGKQDRSVKLVGGSCGQETVVPLTGIREFFLKLISLYSQVKGMGL